MPACRSEDDISRAWSLKRASDGAHCAKGEMLSTWREDRDQIQPGLNIEC
jgi:hypothetical protein